MEVYVRVLVISFMAAMFFIALSTQAAPIFRDQVKHELDQARRKLQPSRKILPINTRVGALPPAVLKLDQPEAVNACIESICGPAQQNFGAYDATEAWKQQDLNFKRRWSEVLDPQIRRAISADGQNRKRMKERLDALLADDQTKIDPQHGMRMIWHYSALMRVAPTLAREALIPRPHGGTVRMTLNREKLREKMANASNELFEAVALVTERIYIPLMENVFLRQAGFFENPTVLRMRSKYPSLNLQAAIKRDATKLLAGISALRSELGKLQEYQVASADDQALITKAREGKELDSFESAQYADLALTIETYAALLVPDMKMALKALPFDSDTLLANLRKAGTPAIDFLEGESLENHVRSVEQACREPLQISIAMRGSKLRLRKTKEFIASVMTAGTEVAVRLAQPGMEATTRQTLEQTEFVMPDETPVERLKFEYALSQRRKRADESIRLLETPDRHLDQLLLYAAAMQNEATETVSNRQTQAEEDELASVCSRFQIQTVTDATLTSLGRILVSWFSVNFPRDGVGIIAHEFGHVVSKTLRSGGPGLIITPGAHRFADSLNCVARRNPFYQTTGGPLMPWQNSVWSEEDWADYFSAQILLELQKQSDLSWRNSPRNYGCAMVVDTGTLYGRNSIIPTPQDPHSSGFLRLLMLQNDLGQSTSACEPMQAALAELTSSPLRCEIKAEPSRQ